MKKLLSFALMMTLCACGGGAVTTEEVAVSQPKEYETINTVRLTVSEGKRLIAKGLFANDYVQSKLNKGMVIITRGTTNTYIAEEFVNYSGPRGSMVTGKIIPQGQDDFTNGVDRVNDIVIVDGKVVDLSYTDALAKMTDGDVIFKGANLLNYEKGQAAICIGAPDGGTVARLMPYANNGSARWFIPIGLEKDCSGDLFEYSDMLALNSERRNKATLLWVTDKADIYTEIEAIKEFADVDVFPVAHGGVAGAEGGVSLLLCGSVEEVKKATAAAESVLGEAPFVQ